MDNEGKAQLIHQIRQARSKFAAMAATYCLGVFNDSFFRQSAMLIALSQGHKAMQGYVMAVFTLPYLLFAAPAGWLADRFSKRHVVIGAKILELVAMLCGAVGICTSNWLFILLMVFIMGLQSAIFSPSLNGSIPELYPPSYVVTANAILKAVVAAAILAGVASCGAALRQKSAGLAGIPVGRLIVSVVIVSVSALGMLCSLGVPWRKAASPHAPFPWTGPLNTLRELYTISRDSLLAIIVAAAMFAWFVGAMLIQIINVLAMKQFGRDEGVASYMVASELVGIAIGGLAGSRIAKGQRWYRVLPPAALSMALLMVIMGGVPYLPANMHLTAIYILLALIGAAGGMFLIPCEAFIQVRPAANKKGAVIAAANFAVFTGILLSGSAANGLTSRWRATDCIAMIGALALIVCVWLFIALGRRQES